MAYLLRYHSPGGPVVNPIYEVDSDEEIDDYHQPREIGNSSHLGCSPSLQ
jgi:hypothetical protein